MQLLDEPIKRSTLVVKLRIFPINPFDEPDMPEYDKEFWDGMEDWV